MIKLPEPAYNGVAHSVQTGDTPSTIRRTTVIVEALPSYSADQIKQAIRDALEEAAKVCETRATYWHRDDGRVNEDEQCATAIRKLKEDTQ